MGKTFLLIVEVIMSSYLLFRLTQASEQLCGTPPVPLYGSIKGTVKESYRIGSYVEYVCNYGYKLEGADIIVCTGSQEGGKWNSLPPFCIPIDCGNPEYPINGRVTIPSGTRLGAKVWYACNDGYDLVGSEFRTCGQDEQWTPLLPKCKSRHCPVIRSPPYGRVTTTGSTPGSVASYKCNVGFVLVGVLSRVCQNSGVWSGSTPTCNIVDCGIIPNPTNGQVKFPDGTTLNRQAWFSCYPGYELVGSEFSTCLSTGEWIPAAPICRYVPKITRCPTLPTPYKGTVLISGNSPGSTATYSCTYGYLIFGNHELVCLDNGQWSGPPPSCTPVDCGRLYSPLNGHVEVRSTKLGAFANYFCKEGFYLVGGKSVHCQINGKWSGKAPYCEPIDCGPLPAITYGQVTLVNQNTKFGAAAIYKCASGYSLHGLTELICLSSGKWSGDPPKCSILDCGILDPPSDGIVELSGTGQGDKAYYSCHTGFTLDGQEKRVCQEDGEWSDAAPSCTPIRCDHLHSPPNGLVHVVFKTVGSQATYECFKGFILDGFKYRTCHPDGYWSGEEPVCKGITCEPLISPANGAVSTTGQDFGSKARYRCQSGYTLYGDNDIRVCQEDGYWSGQSPSCVFNGCSRYLENPLYGHVTISGTSLGSTATYQCDHGYVLDRGHKQRVCRNNGEWSGLAPVCVPAPPPIVECSKLVNPQNGRVYLTGREAGSSATYSCNHGYNLIGAAKLICEATGYWSGTPPTCKRIVVCPSLRDPQYGYVDISGTNVGSTAYYTCSKGTILLGEPTRTCTKEGWWSGTEPRCHFPGCPNLDAPENGHVTLTTKSVGAQAVYSCKKGFVLKGKETQVCQSDATWSGTAPTCETVQCEELSEHRNGRIILTGTAVGSKATYICFPKFTLLGVSTRVCQPNGEWSGVPPFCEFIDCGFLSNPENGRVVLSGTICGSTASYSCNEGYRLVGNTARSCLTDASWSGSAPICIAVNCGVLGNPANGRVVVTGTSPSSKATYSCNKGYTLFGSRTRVCQTNGKWTEEQPVCKRVVQCKDLVNPANGVVKQRGNTLGSTAIYTCNSGFVLTGRDTRNCQANGEWSGVTPLCRRVTCDDLIPPENGVVDQNGNKPGYIATYTCDTGYELVGTGARTCQTNGRWSGVAPTCSFIVVCEYLGNPSNGNVDQTGSRPGSTATYTCDHSYQLVGQDTRTCQDNGEWSGQAPRCRLITCDRLPDPANGDVNQGGNRPGDTATYTCDRSYELVGQAKRTCQNNGEWSGKAPTCRLITCDRLPDPANGDVDQSGNRPGSTATYTCDRSYQLVGKDTRTCQNNGEWSGKAPTCRLFTCDRLPDPANGDVDQGVNRPGDTATYTCDRSYQLVGQDTRTCQDNGEWSGQAPRCRLITCDRLSDPANGDVDQGGNRPGDTATYTCDRSYQLVGQDTRTCQDNGEWSGKAPSCMRQSCGRPEAPRNGFVKYKCTAIGCSAKYSCRNGYTLKGSRYIRCESNGSWSRSTPACKKHYYSYYDH